MSFFRPEALARVARWQETAVAVGATLFGAWWALTGLGFIRLAGIVILFGGLALSLAAIQRARFGGGAGGLGLVEVDERQVSYMAPVGGGFASIEALTEVAIGPDMAGRPVWRLKSGMELLTIPASAEGTAALFDVLTALPGANIEAAIRASRTKGGDKTVIWSAGKRG